MTTPLSACLVCSICSEEMSRDLSAEVEKLLKSSNPYVVRKASFGLFLLLFPCYLHVSIPMS